MTWAVMTKHSDGPDKDQMQTYQMYTLVAKRPSFSRFLVIINKQTRQQKRKGVEINCQWLY